MQNIFDSIAQQNTSRPAVTFSLLFLSNPKKKNSNIPFKTVTSSFMFKYR